MNVIGSALIKIVPDATGFTGALQTQVAGAASAMGGMTGRASGATAALNKMAAGATAVAARANAAASATRAMSVGFGAIAFFGFRAATNFESAMLQVQAVTEATSEEFTALEQSARALGREGLFTATEAAQGMNELARAGLTVDQVMTAIPKTLQLAAAAGIAVADSAIIAATQLNVYRLAAEDLGRVNDVLAQTDIDSATSMKEIGDALKYAAPIAATTKTEFEEMSAALGLLANAGFRGEMGGTALRGMMTRLMNPTRKAKDILDELGVTIMDADGTMRPLVEIMRDFEDAGLTAAQAMTLMGQRAGPGFLGMLQQGSEALAELTENNRNAGREVEVLAEKLRLPEAAMESLQAAFDSTVTLVNDLGFNTDDTTGVLALFAERGMDAAQAADVLTGALEATKKEGFAALIGASRDANGRLVDAEGNVLSLTQIIAELQTSGLTSAEALSSLGDAGADLAEVARLDVDSLVDFAAAANDTGRAAEIAEIQMSGMRGSLQRMKGALEGVAIAMFSGGLLSGLADLTHIVANLLNAISEVSPAILSVATGLILMAAVTSPLLSIVGFLSTGFANLAKAMGFILSNPIILVIAATATAFYQMYQASARLREEVAILGSILGGAISRVFGNITGASGDAGASISDVLIPALEWLGDRLATVLNYVSRGYLLTFAAIIFVWGKAADAARWLADAVGDLGARMGGAALDGLRDLADGIGDYLAPRLETARSNLGDFGDDLHGLYDIIIEGDDVAQRLAESIDGMFGNSGEMVTPIREAIEPLERFGQQVRNLYDVIAEGDDVATGSGEVIDAMFGNTGKRLGPIRDLVVATQQFVDKVGQLSSLTTVADGFSDSFDALTHGDFSGVMEGLVRIRDGFTELVTHDIPAIFSGLSDLLHGPARAVAAGIATDLREGVRDIPIVGPIVDIIVNQMSSMLSRVELVADLIDAVFRGDMGAVRAAVETFAATVGSNLRELPGMVAEVLADASDLTDIVRDWLAESLQGVVDDVDQIPFVGPIVETLRDGLLGGLDNLGDGLDILAGFVADIEDHARDLADSIGNVLEDVDLLSDPLASAGGAADVLGRALGILDSLAEDAASGLQILGDVLGAAFDGDFDLAGDLLGQFADGMRSFVQEDVPAVLQALTGPVIASFGTWLADGLSQATEGLDAVPIIGPLVDGIIEAIRDLTTGIGREHNFVGELLSGGDAGPAGEALLDQVLQTLGNVAQTAGNMLLDASDLLDVFTGWYDRTSQGLVDHIRDVPIFGPIAQLSRDHLVAQLTGLSIVADLVGALFAWDATAASAAADRIVPFIRETITDKLAAVADLTADTADLTAVVSEWISSALSAAVEALADVPVVDDVIEIVRGALVAGFGSLEGLLDITSGIFSADPGKIAEGAGTVITSLLEGIAIALPAALTGLSEILTEWIGAGLEALTENTKDLPIIGGLIGAISNAIRANLSSIAGFGDILAGLFTLDPDLIREGIETSLDGMQDFLSGLPGQMLDAVGDWYEFASGMFRDIADAIADFIPGLFDWIADLPENAADAIVEHGPAVGRAIIGGILIGLRYGVVEIPRFMVTEFIPAALEAIVGFAQRLPEILGNIFGGIGDILWSVLSNLPGLIMGFQASLGRVLVRMISAAFGVIVRNGPTILQAVAGFFLGLPMRIIGWIGDLGGILLDAVGAAFDWIVANGPTILQALGLWWIGLPARILGWIGDLGGALLGLIGAAFDWIVTNGPTILTNLANWWLGMNMRILGWIGDLGGALLGFIGTAFQWIVDNGPTLLIGLGEWWMGLPGTILGWLGDMGSTLYGWLEGGFQYLVDNGPELLAALMEWVEGIPDMIGDALGGIGQVLVDAFKAGWNFLAGKWNEIVAGKGVTIPDVPGLPGRGERIEIPALPLLENAMGGIYNRPTAALVGEAGKEVVIPLTRPDRAMALAQQSGLLDVLSKTGRGKAGLLGDMRGSVQQQLWNANGDVYGGAIGRRELMEDGSYRLYGNDGGRLYGPSAFNPGGALSGLGEVSASSGIATATSASRVTASSRGATLDDVVRILEDGTGQPGMVNHFHEVKARPSDISRDLERMARRKRVPTVASRG